MSHPPQDPHQLPIDAGAGDLAGHIGEDIARTIMARLALFASLLSFVVGIFASPQDAISASAMIAGGMGALGLTVALLTGWPRSRQWLAITIVIIVCGALVVATVTR